MDYLILKFRLHRLHPTLKNESSDHVVLQQVLWTWGKLSLLIKWTLPFLNLPIFKRTNHPPAKGQWIWRPRLQVVWFALDAYTAHLETLRDNLTWLKERLVKMLYHIIWTCQSLVCNWRASTCVGPPLPLPPARLPEDGGREESPRSRLPPPDLHQQLQAGSLINIQHTGDGKPLGSTGLNSTYS